MSEIQDRFQAEVDSIAVDIRRLQRDQAAVTWRSPQWHGYQREIDALVETRRRSQHAIPAMRRVDRTVTIRLVLVLLLAMVVLGALVWGGVLSPWWWAGELVLGALVWGVLSSPR